MIVTCEECSTSFQLDDARIPASGARVRCSRCKHAFFLPNPSASQSQAIHDVVADTLDGESVRGPAPDRDLASPRGAEPEEEDWQFSEEIRVADDEPDDAERSHAASPRADSFDLTGDFGRGFDPETFASAEPPSPKTAPAARPASPRSEPRSKPAPAPTAASAAAPSRPAEPEANRDESSFGSIDDFSSLIDDDDVSIDLATEPVTEARRATPTKKSAAPRSPAEDLGDPESWDIVGPGSERKPAPAATSPIASAASGAARKKKNAKSGLELFADADLPPIRESKDPGAALTTLTRSLRGAGRIVGALAATLSVAFVAITLARPEWSRWAPAPQRIAIGPLVAETTRTGWVETSRAGFLLVVEGELRNTGSQPVAPMAVQLALLDGEGTRLSAPALRVGRPLAAEALRESKAEDLDRQVEEARVGWSSSPLAPGEARRFTAIARADGWPEGARRLLLEAGKPSGS